MDDQIGVGLGVGLTVATGRDADRLRGLGRSLPYDAAGVWSTGGATVYLNGATCAVIRMEPEVPEGWFCEIHGWKIGMGDPLASSTNSEVGYFFVGAGGNLSTYTLFDKTSTTFPVAGFYGTMQVPCHGREGPAVVVSPYSTTATYGVRAWGIMRELADLTRNVEVF